jgi:hypothetical protein
MTYEARHSKNLNYALIAGCLLVSLIGFAAVLIPSKDGSGGFIGWVIIGACFAAAFIFYRRAADQSPQARVDGQGVWSRRHAETPVPWADITAVQPIRAGIQRIVRFQLRDPSAKAFGINTTFYDRGMADLLAAVRDHRPDLGA